MRACASERDADWRLALDRDGYAVVPAVLTRGECERLAMSLASVSGSDPRPRAGVRDLLAASADVRELARSDAFRQLVDEALSPSAFPVRAILFDKTPETNWHVAWHQDLTIAVAERVDGCEGFGPWSVKSGVAHVQPPARILERMVTLRLHVDDCGAENGPLSVVPGSHLAGITEAIPNVPSGTSGPSRANEENARVCPVEAGGVLVMRPLLWHASGKALAPARRRVVHVEYADVELPPPLRWHERATRAS